MSESPVAAEPLLRMRGIVKEFPGVRALDGVDLDVQVDAVQRPHAGELLHDAPHAQQRAAHDRLPGSVE